MSILSGHIINEQVIVEGPDSITLYNKGFYGSPNKEGIILSGFEALHLSELERITIHNKSKNAHMTFSEISAYFTDKISNFMTRYLVYKDLRNRGYIVNQGKGSSFFFRLYTRGSIPKKDTAKFYVTPLQEGTSINLHELDDLLTLSYNSKKELVLGLVDSSGDVSYLKVNELTPNKIDNPKLSNWDWEKLWNDFHK